MEKFKWSKLLRSAISAAAAIGLTGLAYRPNMPDSEMECAVTDFSSAANPLADWFPDNMRNAG